MVYRKVVRFLINIVDGDTFNVSGWEWNSQKGNRVRPTGYDAPELNTHEGQIAKDKLTSLIFGKYVELRTAYKVDRGRLICDVYFKGKHLADYFAEYKN